MKSRHIKIKQICHIVKKTTHCVYWNQMASKLFLTLNYLRITLRFINWKISGV